MKRFITTYILFTCVLIIFSCSSDKKETAGSSYVYKPDDRQLHDTIVHLDSLFFAAYNTCDVNLDKYASFYADSLEFYHDKGGLTTSKQDVVEGTKKNICGKVTRELVKGSIEVYPIANYGAIEMGLHLFHNNTEKNSGPADPGKFIMIWEHKNKVWKIKRVVSLH